MGNQKPFLFIILQKYISLGFNLQFYAYDSQIYLSLVVNFYFYSNSGLKTSYRTFLVRSSVITSVFTCPKPN